MGWEQERCGREEPETEMCIFHKLGGGGDSDRHSALIASTSPVSCQTWLFASPRPFPRLLFLTEGRMNRDLRERKSLFVNFTN